MNTKPNRPSPSTAESLQMKLSGRQSIRAFKETTERSETALRGQQRHHAFGGVVAIQVNLNVSHS